MDTVIIQEECVSIASETSATAPRKTEMRPEVVQALESFADTWEIATVHPDGATGDARWLVFKEDGNYAAHGADGKELWAGTFEIDPTTTPRVWDHRSHESKLDGGDVLGIYELDGDTLHVACVPGQWNNGVWIGKPRPASFSTTEADVLIMLKRAETDINLQPSRSQSDATTLLCGLPQAAMDFVLKVNERDEAGLIDLFAEDATVDDAGKLHQGREAIREWMASEIFAPNVTFEVIQAKGDEKEVEFTAQINGDFDRTGLPDPLIMSFQLHAPEGKITRFTSRLPG